MWKWWSGCKKKCCRLLSKTHSVSMWKTTTESFLIDGSRQLYCYAFTTAARCRVIQKLWRESKAKLCHQKIQYLHSWSWWEKFLKNLFFFLYRRVEKTAKVAKRGRHTYQHQKEASKHTIFSKIPTGKRICLQLLLPGFPQHTINS